MRIPLKRLKDMLGYIRFPVDVKHDAGSDLIAIRNADRPLVESLVNEEAVAGLGSRGAITALYLVKPLSELRTTIRKLSLPIAADCRTTFREDLGNGRFVFQHSMARASSYAPEARLVA